MAMPSNQNQPILDTLIMDKAPLRIIKDFENRFADLIDSTDNSRQYSIDIAHRYNTCM